MDQHWRGNDQQGPRPEAETPRAGGSAPRRLKPRPLAARPVRLRAARAGGRPTGPILLPAFRAAGVQETVPGAGHRGAADRAGDGGPAGPGAGGGTGAGVAGETGAVNGPGPNQKDDIRQSLWVRRPDLFYGKPNRGHHRAAFAGPLAPARDEVTGRAGGTAAGPGAVRPAAGDRGPAAGAQGDGEAGRGDGDGEARASAAPGDDRLAALRREGNRRVPAARELLPAGDQGVPAAVDYAPDRPAAGRVDRQVAAQLARRPSPSSQGRPMAAGGRADGAAGAVRWEAAAEPAAPGTGRGDPAADVTAPAGLKRPGTGSAEAPSAETPSGSAGPAGAGSSDVPAAMVQEVGGVPVPLNPTAALEVATGPGADPAVRASLGATVAQRVEAATELRPRLRLRAPLRPRPAAAEDDRPAPGVDGRPPGDRSTDVTALTRGAIREARARWAERAEAADGTAAPGEEGPAR